jgi:cytochrome c oxidase assembly protein subunit 15
MTGGIYYEHAHRLFGSLVGLTTLTLTGMILVRDPRRSLKIAGIVASLLVIFQGILGGLRVTGTFTLSTSPEDMTPSTLLAMVHGVTGQLFLALLVGIAVAASPTFRGTLAPRATKHAGGERTFSALLVAVVVMQLVLGAYYRHTGAGIGLILHITGATLVAVVALVVGLRVWGLHGQGEGRVSQILGRHGVWLMCLLGVQLCLGMAALAAIMARGEGEGPGSLEVVFATAHQLTGALLLALSVATALWVRRLLVQGEEGTG